MALNSFSIELEHSTAHRLNKVISILLLFFTAVLLIYQGNENNFYENLR